ncbi:hypothetical protein PACTADRAFT_47867 [Pachysolen tannophilus NRRL Y-2460]|uniref:Protein SIP5 n=1 Tax=Pachysolen tannophilus NRRL Y-2460 TaxID=669874 RepID=A0A1E4U210_PACTA|nr:hypothetical protein PACTADRAFT_47867 [Pachysolen tannophilus NRRL Y-2460]
MGNVPAKETEQTTTRRPRGISIGSISNGANTSLPFSGGNTQSILKKSKREKEKERAREEHAWNLIVRYEETVDGGFLAPYGTYNSNLYYKTDTVKTLIIDRKLAPFYTPLQDFESSWTDNELLVILDKLTLHSKPSENDDEEEEDMDIHKFHRSSNAMRKLESKKNKQLLKIRAFKWQEDAEIRYAKDKNIQKQGIKKFPFLPSKDLQLKLYRNATECPICFLYYPPYLNLSRCCVQPICTECFVQIKRLDPHPPHDEEGNVNENDEKNPEALISEPAKCPFCAMSDFGVTYMPPNFRTGLGGIPPADYKNQDTTTITEEGSSSDFINTNNNSNSNSTSISLAISKTHSAAGTPPRNSPSLLNQLSPDGNYNYNNNNNNNNNNNYNHGVGPQTSSPSTSDETVNVKRKRRGSLPPNAPGVVMSDAIRPDWEAKLKNSRLKLARRSAAASAIHATSLIYDHNTNGIDVNNTNGGNGGNLEFDNNHYVPNVRQRSETMELEERMIAEALRLSLVEAEERERLEKEKKKKLKK